MKEEDILFVLNSDCSVINTTPEEIGKVLNTSKLKIYGLIEPNYGWNVIGFKKDVLQSIKKNFVNMQSSNLFEKVDLWSVDEIGSKF